MPSAARLRTDRFDRILVICTRQIGDVLLTTPVISAAKARWPEAAIDVLGFAGTLGVLKGNPDIRALVEVPAGSGWTQSLGLVGRLWRRYDLAIVAQYSDRAHLYGAIAGRRRTGQVPVQVATSWWKRALLVHHVEIGFDRTHAVLEKLDLLAPWAEPPREVRVTPPAAVPLPPAVAAALGARYVAIQVPTVVRYKQWPIPHYVELVAGLLRDGLQVVLTGGPLDADRQRVAEVEQGVAGRALAGALLNVAGALDLGQMVTLLRGATLYIGPDTSITHLAAACETPLVALYGPVDPRIFGPWPQGHPAVQPYVRRALRQVLRAPGASGEGPARVVLLQGDPSCVPCNLAGCDRHNESRSECLETMRPERVLAEARALLRGEALPPQPAVVTFHPHRPLAVNHSDGASA